MSTRLKLELSSPENVFGWDLQIEMPLLATTPQEDMDKFYELVQSHAAQLGFHHKAQLRQQLESNTRKASVFWARLNGELVGYTACGSRQHYAHLMRMGDIAVPEKLRRQRIGTALYAAVIATAVLEGRRQLEDTIIYSLSPFMADGFGPSLGFTQAGILKERTGGFRDIHLLQANITLDWLKKVFARVTQNTTINLVDQQTARDGFITQMKDYEDKRPELVADLTACRAFIHEKCVITHDGIAGGTQEKKGFFPA